MRNFIHRNPRAPQKIHRYVTWFPVISLSYVTNNSSFAKAVVVSNRITLQHARQLKDTSTNFSKLAQNYFATS